ncbi:MAG: alpha/beta hydrolase domain-containing protein [Bacteroidota bacterium]
MELQVPLATYFPWNVRRGMAGGNGELSDFRGTWLPFAPTDASKHPQDPRPSVESLYRSKNIYLRKVNGAIESLISDGFLLPRDREHVRVRAMQYWEFVGL